MRTMTKDSDDNEDDDDNINNKRIYTFLPAVKSKLQK